MAIRTLGQVDPGTDDCPSGDCDGDCDTGDTGEEEEPDEAREGCGCGGRRRGADPASPALFTGAAWQAYSGVVWKLSSDRSSVLAAGPVPGVDPVIVQLAVFVEVPLVH